METKEFSFRLQGNWKNGTPVSPKNLDIRDFEEFFIEFKKFILASTDKKTDSIGFEYQEGSSWLKFLVPVSLFFTLTGILNTIEIENSLQNIPLAQAKSLEIIQKKIKSLDGDFSLSLGDFEKPSLIIKKKQTLFCQKKFLFQLKRLFMGKFFLWVGKIQIFI